MKNLNGIWYNELGSMMKLKVKGKTISGTYQTKVGEAQGVYPLVGLIDTDNDLSHALGWIVVWQNRFGSSDSVTTWCGQVQNIDKIPTIVTTWLLTQETNPQDDWKSTLIGKDSFTRVPLSKKAIQQNIKKGVKSAFPGKK